jgi:lipopolysaccharide transport system permease protein
LNPMTPIIEGIRMGLFGSGTFSVTYLGYSILMTSMVLIIGTISFNRVQKNFVDTV